MKYLIIFFLLFTSISLQAERRIVFGKFSLIDELDYHKQEALFHLKEADNLCFYIPDLEKREHMHALIGSVISAYAIPDPKAKILSVGLALIGSLSVDIYDQFCEYRMHLIRSSYHVEMINFYHSLSLKFTERATDDRGAQAFMAAIDCLTYCDMLAFVIDGIIDWGSDDPRKGVTESIRDLRKYFIKEFKKSDYKVTKKLREKGTLFYENLGEILSECSDNLLKDKICTNIREMLKNLEAAERMKKDNCMPIIVGG